MKDLTSTLAKERNQNAKAQDQMEKRINELEEDLDKTQSLNRGLLLEIEAMKHVKIKL